jgi:hypothetical protein
MLNQNFKTFYEKIVDRLILQYEEYLFLSKIIQKLENERFIKIAEIAQKRNIKIQNVIKKEIKSLNSIDKKIYLYKIDLQRISDEMTYPNHYVWMMYKDKAYKGTNNEIATLGDFKRHCLPTDYICTVRYNFLREFLKKNKKIDLNNNKKYPTNIRFIDFYNKRELINLLTNIDFLIKWKKNEYFISNNTINKWNVLN